jgi:hypothetical protein
MKLGRKSTNIEDRRGWKDNQGYGPYLRYDNPRNRTIVEKTVKGNDRVVQGTVKDADRVTNKPRTGTILDEDD